MITAKMNALANQIAFYVQQYPEKTLGDILKLLEVPAVDINTGIWLAVNNGWIAEPAADGEMKFLREPGVGWEFSKDVYDLEHAMIYGFTETAKRRKDDLEEVYLANWTNGYKQMDVLTAIKHLLVTKHLFEYELKDQQRDEGGQPVFAEDEITPVMDTYIFYTLYENRDKKWGRKQFKTPPAVQGGDEKEG